MLNKIRSLKKRIKQILKILILTIGIIAILIAGTLIYLQNTITPPEVSTVRRPQQIAARSPDLNHPTEDTHAPESEPEVEFLPLGETRDQLTFLILGTDDEGGGQSDVIIIARFDPIEYTLNLVSIPRDTLINSTWTVARKANAIMPRMKHMHRDEGMDAVMEAVVDQFADLLGFEVDFYITLDMDAFVRIVDAAGGVEFDVPRNMFYPMENINVRRGFQRLSGQQALGVVRFRQYAQGDIGRINVQQDLMKAAIPQIMERIGLATFPALVDIFFNYVETDLSISDILWLAQTFYRFDIESINFMMMPGNIYDHIAGLSYVTIFVDEWLEMVNTYLNPFSEEIMPTDVSIITRGPGRRLFVTDDHFAANPNWGQPG
ncbi:MAG: LCP family protein [Oscillospiraceae bacterium]|nr:LCP family protein [Oscillospiraceae bacterium]